MIKDLTGRHDNEVRELEKFLMMKMPSFLKKFVPPIEIWNSSWEVYAPEKIAEIKKEYPEYNPDLSSGDYSNGTIRLFERAFRPFIFESSLSEKSELKMINAKYTLVHEFGHHLYGLFYGFLIEKDLISLTEWNNARGIDGDERQRQILADYAEDIFGIYGFWHPRVISEDFANSFRDFILDPFFNRHFPNRFVFIQKFLRLIEQLKIPS